MANIGNDLRAVDMDEFVKHDYNNSVYSLEVLRGANYWMHFEIIANCYHDLFQITDPTISGTHSKMAWLHFLSGSNVNLVKGVSSILAGHFTDSSIYVRRTVESIRYSVFIRENPNLAKIWFAPDGKKEFGDKYRKWFHERGKQTVESEFARSSFYFEHSSNYGPHPNAELFSYQHNVSYKDSKMDFRILYHELEPSERGYHSLLATYFWHLKIHASAIDWWVHKSGFINHLTKNQIQFWSECRQNVDKDENIVKEKIRIGPLGKA